MKIYAKDKRYLWYFDSAENHDKVYMVAYLVDEKNKGHVYTAWGRRGGTLSKDLKDGSLASANAAVSAKQKKGYEEVVGRNSDEKGIISSCETKMWNDLSGFGFDLDGTRSVPKAVVPKSLKWDGKPVVCVSNLHLEDMFERDIEYLCLKKKDDNFLIVIDRMGKEQEVSMDRFELAE